MPIRLGDDVSIPDLERGYPRLQNRTFFYKIINCIRIYNIPLINFAIIGILGVFLVKLTTKYTILYMRSSLITIIVTNLVLYGISETLAQSILAYNKTRPMVAMEINDSPLNGSGQLGFAGIGLRSPSSHPFAFAISPSPPPRSSGDTNRSHGSASEFEYNSEEDDNDIERFLEYVQEDPASMSDSGLGEQPFPNTIPHVPLTYYKFDRLAGFMSWGFIMSFAQCWWYKFLQIYSKDPKFIEVLRKVLTDQLCFSPVSLFLFFTYGTIVLDNRTWEDAKIKLSKIYLKTLMVNYSVWFPVQFFNFLFVPRSLQVPFSSSVSVLWNCFLSMKNSNANNA